MIGMALTRRRSRQIVQPAQAITYSPPELGCREELESLMGALGRINSQIDARVGEHSMRVEEITDSLENGCDLDRALLVRAAKLLVAANQQLQADLAVAETELQDQRELAECFRRESRTDALTELLNRRAFDGELNASLANLNRDHSLFSLLLIDIDHFKRVNDEHGHLNGDQVLLTVAQCLKSSLHEPVSVSRYGGEEFAVIVPDVSGNSALKIAERLRCAIEQCPIYVEGKGLQVTVSIGVTQAFEGDTRSELIERADQALFTAKNSGRNQCFHELRKGGSPILETAAGASRRSNASVMSA